MDLKQRLSELVGEAFNVPPSSVTDDYPLSEGEIPSVAMFKLAFAVEGEFDLQIPDSTVAGFGKMSDLVAYVMESWKGNINAKA